MRDLNQVLEHGLSPRGIRWRIEAWRSGVPFAQIVLRHCLRYQVDPFRCPAGENNFLRAARPDESSDSFPSVLIGAGGAVAPVAGVGLTKVRIALPVAGLKR